MGVGNDFEVLSGGCFLSAPLSPPLLWLICARMYISQVSPLQASLNLLCYLRKEYYSNNYYLIINTLSGQCNSFI